MTRPLFTRQYLLEIYASQRGLPPLSLESYEEEFQEWLEQCEYYEVRGDAGILGYHQAFDEE